MLPIKERLLEYCRTYVQQRMDTAQRAIEVAQASAWEETKSSAGDKYETGRAMMQLEVEKNSIQLGEAKKLKPVLDQIQVNYKHTRITLGSLVMTDHGNFFIAISAGQCTLEEIVYLIISPVTPLGVKLMGLRQGDSFTFNQRSYLIQQVW